MEIGDGRWKMEDGIFEVTKAICNLTTSSHSLSTTQDSRDQKDYGPVPLSGSLQSVPFDSVHDDCKNESYYCVDKKLSDDSMRTKKNGFSSFLQFEILFVNSSPFP